MKTHTIHWKSRATGMMGSGTILFEKEAAERLADELNRNYPGIYHEAVCALPDLGETATAHLANASHS
jgi:hypothetical protein